MGWDRRTYDRSFLVAAGAMVLAGACFFGWRALVTAGTAAGATVGLYLIIDVALRVTHRQRKHDLMGQDMAAARAVWLGLLAGACLPPLVAWPMALAAGVVTGAAAHVTGRSHRVRVHPVAVALVLVWLVPVAIEGPRPAAYRRAVVPAGAVLLPEHVFTGDLKNVGPELDLDPWLRTLGVRPAARRIDPTLLVLSDQRTWLRDASLLPRLLRSGDVPPLGDLLLGAVPGPLGASSPLLMIVLLWWLIARGAASWQAPLAAFAVAVGVYALLPLEHAGGWTVAGARLWAMPPATSAVLLGYAVLASPLPLLACVLAPATEPISGGGRWVYGALLGAGVMGAWWWGATPEAAYAAVVAVGLLSRPLDAVHRGPGTGLVEVASET